MRRLRFKAVSFALYALVCSFGAAAQAQEARSELVNSAAVVRVNSAQTGTGVIVRTVGRTLLVLTASHVVGGVRPTRPPCTLSIPKVGPDLPCEVLVASNFASDGVDIALLRADASEIPGTFRAAELALSAGDMKAQGETVYTYGYPGGAALRRDEGRTSGAQGLDITLEGIAPIEGQSGSPVFRARDGKIVGMITTRSLSQEQRANRVENLRWYLRNMSAYFEDLPSGAPQAAAGELVSSDAGPALVNLFAEAASPERWYERAKRYARADTEKPALMPSPGLLGVRRVYSSSRANADGAFGRGWRLTTDYRIDFEASSLCEIFVVNPLGARIRLTSASSCAEAKQRLAPLVSDPTIVSRQLGELMASSLTADLLPQNAPSYVGGDYGVARLRLVPDGLELSVGTATYGFNSQGRIRQVRKPEGVLDIDYDAEGRVAVMRSDDRTQEFVYGGGNHVKELRFSDGSFHRYAYDPQGRLVGVSEGVTPTKRYAYDGGGRLSEVEALGPSKSLTRIGYDASGTRHSVENDAGRYEWTFEDDENGLTKVTQRSRTSSGYESERTYAFDYQARKLRMAENDVTTEYILTNCLCLPLSVSRGEQSTSYAYDPFGRLTLKSERGGEATRIGYHPRLNKVTSVEVRSPGGEWRQTLNAAYDDKGQLISIASEDASITLVYNREGLILTSTFGEDRLSFAYTVGRKPYAIQLAGLGSIRVTYDDSGEIQRVDSDQGHQMALRVTNAFQSLLGATNIMKEALRQDVKFSRMTSEPGACDTCTTNLYE
jgi:YD repeat-containing protein